MLNDGDGKKSGGAVQWLLYTRFPPTALIMS